ncbi:hypothetical protein ONE63_009646 [Megalurothrips usitatus]|uniref:Sushi, von Willebrand factor type A, EGF and pentraxin domain-containing protein 1-like n=1 Tax=Megalurothrips usitatus TaxID=439358 RepID=A0AAV7XJZ8_9NEOP|nr:hypothetical protein ONE63_009646 [Megalurothrips usitatus]
MAHQKLHCFLPFLAFLGQLLERAHSTHGLLSNPGDLKIVASKEVFENDTIVAEGAVLLYQKNTSMHHQNETMKKINELGVKLKDKVEMLHMNKKLDVVFLIDASSSVGDQNFNSELRFVKKLLADFAISANETRVAVITFSDEDKVVRHIDHISVPSEENHKCNMLHHDLPNIKYSGGLTYTLGALVEAQSVLEWSRTGAHKAIFLITDGFSNGGDPMPVADLLKANGTFIFTFGIQSGNIIELEYMSSSPSDEFSYFVGSFDQFEALVRRALHQDLSTGSYQHLKISSPCNLLCSDYDKEDKGCCDNHAHCSCGTGSGHYRCLCNPGFYGSGLKGTCHACPNGTYHDGQTPGDKFVCSPCSDPNHITVLGTASSKASCICKRGFVARGDSCEVITCPMLFPPEHGYFVKGGMCSNVFNAACGMRCKAGYSLHGSSIRLCQDNGMWSGKSPKCIVKMCPDPEVPINGDVKCSLEPSVSNDLLDTELDDTKDLVRQYAVDTECQFSCKPGHILIGSRRRHCLPLARWDGLRTGCKRRFLKLILQPEKEPTTVKCLNSSECHILLFSAVACRPLNKIFHGSIHPVACTDSSKLPFGQTCNMTCDLGYKLVGPSSRSCGGKGGQWSMKATANKCIGKL